MHIAFYSPLNPVPSGISDYSEELLPLLRREFDIDLVVDDYRPSNPSLATYPVLTQAEFKRRASSYDLILYHMGNSPAHDGIYHTLGEIPGVVVLHDLVLHHLRAWQTVDRHDVHGYIEAMRADYGEVGAELARLEAAGLAGLDRFAYPLNGEVARAARALVVHSAYAARSLARVVPQTPVAVVPMGVPAIASIATAEARARLLLPASAFIVAAFGEVHPHKRVTIALQAFADFHRRFPNSLFLLIGRESVNYETDAIIRRYKIERAVRRVGFAPREDYENYIAAADLCLNLRYPSAGETSASLLRLFAAGKAVIVTRTAAYADLPDSVCAKIEADEYEQDLLTAHLELFAQRPDLIAQLGSNARDFATRCHTLEHSAEAYIDFLRAVAKERPTSRSYLIEWAAGRRPPALDPTHSLLEPSQFKQHERGEQNLPPSTASRPLSEAGSGGAEGAPSLLDSIALDYAELGLDAEDSVLRSIAQALAELGLNSEDR